MTLAERLLNWREVDANGCWLWTGCLDRGGYARVTVRGRRHSVHRLAYALWVPDDPLVDGMQIDHLCRVRRCFNPEHLEQVEPLVNLHRGVSFAAREARQTHCKRGHLLAGDNLLESGLRKGRRVCVICNRDRARRHREQRRREACT